MKKRYRLHFVNTTTKEIEADLVAENDTSIAFSLDDEVVLVASVVNLTYFEVLPSPDAEK